MPRFGGAAAPAPAVSRVAGASPGRLRRWWARRSWWSRLLVLLGAPLGAAAVAGAVVVGYAFATVPLPPPVSLPQLTTLRYADGRVLATLGSVDRRDVALAQVPVVVRHAVLAAEDRNFYTEPGISVTGILRALWTDVSGGQISQGGSTITQQYVKNAYLTDQRTLTRKLTEVVIAVKMAHQVPKDVILDNYLNTIYFGRGAYGIGAASRRYFGIPVSRLDAAQGALLAGLIRGPSVLDPRIDPPAARARWQEVVAAMVRQGWLDPARAAALVFPATIPEPVLAPPAGDGATYYVVQRVLGELRGDGLSAQQVALGGFTVMTTLEPRVQAAAVAAVRSSPGGGIAGAPAGTRMGLVALAPTSGAVRAWVGGLRPGGADAVDYLTAPPGSTFKAVVLAAALAGGIPLQRTYLGASPQTFAADPGVAIHNFGVGGVDEQFGYVDLATATADSINTVYVHLGLDTGLRRIAAYAHRMGIADSRTIPLVEDVTLGQSPFVTPLEMATVYATIASGGTRPTPYLVASVTAPGGQLLYRHVSHPVRVLSRQVAAEETYALQQVLLRGTAAATPLAGGRPAAGKTGTSEGNISAWFTGFTPQLVTSVDLLRLRPGARGPTYVSVNGIDGWADDTGSAVPAHTWKAFMDAALAGSPPLAFPAPPSPLASAPAAAPAASPEPAAPTPSTPATASTPSTASGSPSHPSPTGSVSPTGSASPAPSLPVGSTSSPLPAPTPSPTPSSSSTSSAPTPSPSG